MEEPKYIWAYNGHYTYLTKTKIQWIASEALPKAYDQRSYLHDLIVVVDHIRGNTVFGEQQGHRVSMSLPPSLTTSLWTSIVTSLVNIRSRKTFSFSLFNSWSDIKKPNMPKKSSEKKTQTRYTIHILVYTKIHGQTHASQSCKHNSSVLILFYLYFNIWEINLKILHQYVHVSLWYPCG